MKIVVLTSRFPFPVEKGDKLRAYNHIRGLAERHEVHLISITHQHVDPAAITELEKYCAGIHIFRIPSYRLPWNLAQAAFEGLPLQVGYFLDQSIKQKIQYLILKTEPEHIFTQLIRTSEYVRALPFSKTLDYMDVFSVGMAQRAKAGSFLARPFFRYESTLLARYEKDIYRDFDHHCIISGQDRDRLKVPYTENIHVIPNGVDTHYFSRKETETPYDLLFVGNMGYLPNIEAAEYLVRKILPLCRSRGMQVNVLIAGARPDRRVLRLASRHVKVSGWMEDIRYAYNRSKVFVAPIFSGMGQQNKILEAMSMEMPSITSTMVNNAIGARPGGEIFIADDPAGYAGHIYMLLEDNAQAERTGKAARVFITENYTWSRHLEMLNELIARRSILSESTNRIISGSANI